jgi:hypothetical protein
MRSISRVGLKSVAAGLGCLGVLAVGCQHMVNPFRDDLPATSDVTTASVAGARAAPSRPTVAPRGYEPQPIEAQNGTVAHWPLWWEDPFEDQGSEDGTFAWTAEDYLCVAYGPARFLLNTMAWPVSAVVTPPWTVMCSDGKLSRQALGYDHDVAPCPGGTAPPIDILEMGTYHEEPPATADEAAPAETSATDEG